MPRSKQTAAEYIAEHDGEMRVILGELAENGGKLNMLWTLARMRVIGDPEQALRDLIDAEIALDIFVRIERSDGLRTLRSAISRLDAELPDDEDDDSAESHPTSGDIGAR